jgi:hypothetical protein
MFESHKDVQLEPGSWSLWRTGRKILIFSCPTCRKPKIIRQDVLADGRVVGRVRCIERGCKFDDDLRLAGWVTGEIYP